MKKLLFLILLPLISFVPLSTSAQVQINVNIGSQPLWGPAGYDYVDYYYLPEVESYYYVPKQQFVYLSNGSWVFGLSLPSKYRNYDLYNGYKVVMNTPKPYLHFRDHKVKYAKYKGNHSQTAIIKSRDPKYYVVKGHPKYNGRGKEGNANVGKKNNKSNIKENAKGSHKGGGKGQGK
jgi:hypothetical protein